MFFSAQRQQFFKPLTSKYCEQVAECLRLLYERQYSANADYGESLRREQLIEIFEEALARTPLTELDDPETEDGDLSAARFKNVREQAGWTLNLLVENGWIEKQVDQVTFQSTYPFSRMGRLFTQPLVEANSTRVRTRHRNTRNTLNALEAFLNRGEAHDLLDAYEYSERIITDFTDVIAELEDCKRELVKEVESQVMVQQASEYFFDFMEKRFQPDLSIRLSADSLEKHLRQLAPELLQSAQQSVLWHILDTIELRMRKASDTMLPALRRALQNFTKRADIIIRQIAYLGAQNQSNIMNVLDSLKNDRPDDVQKRLEQAAAIMSPMNLRLIDPRQVVLSERKVKQAVNTELVEEQPLDEQALQELKITQMLEQAFSIRNQELKDYIIRSMRDKKQLNISELPVSSADDLLAMAHAIELGAVNQNSSDYAFLVEPLKRQAKNTYFKQFDEFSITMIKKDSAE